ncbi:MAG: hypothetical protein MJZ12_00985 [Prevotella sp.]|nr:hypothetical protein [Prevotella sp.]
MLAAMKTVLEENGGIMKIDELTDVINQRSLFQSKGRNLLLPWQVKAAARRYRATFIISSDSISF